jgi:hypothetical protein
MGQHYKGKTSQRLLFLQVLAGHWRVVTPVVALLLWRLDYPMTHTW